MSQGVHPAPTAAQKCLDVSWVRDSLFLGGACGWVGGCRWRLLCFANQTLSFLAEVLGEQWRVNHAIRSHLAILSARLARARTGHSKGEDAAARWRRSRPSRRRTACRSRAGSFAPTAAHKHPHRVACDLVAMFAREAHTLAAATETARIANVHCVLSRAIVVRQAGEGCVRHFFFSVAVHGLVRR